MFCVVTLVIVVLRNDLTTFVLYVFMIAPHTIATVQKTCHPYFLEFLKRTLYKYEGSISLKFSRNSEEFFLVITCVVMFLTESKLKLHYNTLPVSN